MVEYLGKKTSNNRSSTYVKSVYALGGGTVKKVELHIRSVLKAPTDPQGFVPEILQEPGEPLGPHVPPMIPMEDTDNSDDNSVVDICQTISIPDTIDAINVPKVATIAVSKSAPSVAPEAAVPKVSATTGEEIGTNTNTSQATDPLSTTTVVLHDTEWYKDDLVSSIDINGSIPDRDFVIRTPVGEVITHNSENPNKYSLLNYLLFMFTP